MRKRCQAEGKQTAPQVVQRATEKAGDLHLGDAEPPADLVLGEVAVEPQSEQLLALTVQLVPVGQHRIEVHCVIQRRVVLAEQVAEAGRAVQTWPHGLVGCSAVRLRDVAPGS